MAVFVDSSTLRPGAKPVMPRDEARAVLAGKKGGEHVPTATAHTSMVVNKLIRLLDESRMRTQFAPSEHFTRALAIWEAATRRAEMGEWLDLCEGMLRGLDPLLEALARLAEHASYSYEDALGQLFMLLNVKDVRKGQFFTPFGVARMMAELTLDDDWRPPYGPAGPPATFYEPACGSGVMFLGIMQVLEERFPESFPALLTRGLIVFRGIDLDPRAILMTTLNLRLRGYPLAAETLTCGNALAQPQPAPEDAVPRAPASRPISAPVLPLPEAESSASPDEQLFFF